MKENIEEEKAIKYYQNKDISFSVDFDTKKLLEALGITEEDSFENHQIRFKTLLNLIEKLQKENEELKHKYDKALSDLVKAEKENEELKRLIAHRNGYTKKLEEDLFENCNNYVISKQKVKDKIEELKERPLTINENNKYYYETDAYNKIIIQVLQDLLEEKGE